MARSDSDPRTAPCPTYIYSRPSTLKCCRKARQREDTPKAENCKLRAFKAAFMNRLSQPIVWAGWTKDIPVQGTSAISGEGCEKSNPN